MTTHPEESPTYIAYTDSGYHICRNGGAYAYILLHDGEIVRKEAFLFRRESNNRGELHAIIAAIENCPDGAAVEIRTDSQYAVNTLTGEWTQRRNTDLCTDATDTLTFQPCKHHIRETRASRILL